MSKEYKSYGEYFDTQRIRIEKAMQNKNTQLHKEWREDFDKRQTKKTRIVYTSKTDTSRPKRKKITQRNDRGTTKII